MRVRRFAWSAAVVDGVDAGGFELVDAAAAFAGVVALLELVGAVAGGVAVIVVPWQWRIPVFESLWQPCLSSRPGCARATPAKMTIGARRRSLTEEAPVPPTLPRRSSRRSIHLVS